MRFFTPTISSKIAGIALSLVVIGLLFQQVSAYPADQDSSIHIPESAWFNNAVYYVAPQNDGKIIVWWLFTGYNWLSANNIIRLHSDGTRDTSFVIWSWFNDQIRAIAIQNDGKIIVWWFFTTYNWVVANRIIRLHSDGTRDTSFVIWSWFNAQVRAIAIQNDGKIILWWAITNYSWTTIHRIIRLNSNGTRDASFDVWIWRNNNVRAIVVQSDGKIILWWGFTISSWVTTNRIVRLHSNWTRDYSFTIWSWFTEQINDIYMTEDEKFFVWWLFTGYNWVAANSIIKLNNDGTIDTSFNIGNWFNNDVRNIKIQRDGKILVWWLFTGYNWATANNIIKLNSDGTIDTSFDIGNWFDAAIHSLTIQKDDKIIVWGDFTSYKSISGWYLARLHGNSLVSLLDTTRTDAIRTEFTSKWYTLSGSVLSGSAPMVFIDTLGKIPVELTIKNNNTILTLPQNMEIKKTSDSTPYTWTFFPPTTITPTNQPNAFAAISVWATTTPLQLTNWLATLAIPMPGQTLGSAANIYYSQDNGVSRNLQTNTTIIDIWWSPYVQFTTDHFTDFAVTLPGGWSSNGTFTINNDASSTSSSTVTLNITGVWITNMRFSNDWSTRLSREPFATSKAWMLPGTYGNKTVYAEFDTDNNTNTVEWTTNDMISYTETSSRTCIWWETVWWVATACLHLEIAGMSGHCTYGNVVQFGINNFDYNARTYSTGFLTTGGNTARYCDDTEGKDNRNVTIQSNTIVNESNPDWNIPASRVFIKNPAATKINGVCSPYIGDSNNVRQPLDSTVTIFGKTSDLGEVCKIQTDNITMEIDALANQAIGTYSGTLTLSIPLP